ncbi:MAG TPA: LacI family DNA-binding transcriptional regulator [Opitutaceae bacterium]|nr:LacI family DNA-binding transcriptional regulator [Opitutaceae bacterium]
MTRRITQTDIARAAGVHSTTVSLALRNSPSIPAATRERICAIAAQMGYAPDPVLGALVAYRHGRRGGAPAETIAYVTRWNSRWGWQAMPGHRELHAGAARRAAELGYRLEHFWLGEPGMTGRRLGDILAARGIGGVVFASRAAAPDRPVELDWSRFSAVRIDRFPHEPSLHHVTNDQLRVIRLAVQRTLAAGHRRIGLVMPRAWDALVDQAWSTGFLAEQARLPASARLPALLYVETPTRPDAPEPHPIDPAALDRWLREHRPEVILGHAPAVLEPLRACGREVPRDAGFVDLFLESGDGRIAGIRHHCARVGEVAIDLLVSQIRQNIRGIPAVPTATLVEGTWVDGATLPVASAAVA